MDFPKNITCIEDVLNIVRKIRYDVTNNISLPFYNHDSLNQQSFFTDIWFRGESKIYDTTLVPKVFRTNFDETTVYNYLPTYVKELREIESDFDRLCYMQHYGVPTRMLDWTDNILNALYFAVNDNNDNDGKIYVLNSRLLNKLTGLRDGNKNILTKDGLGTKFRCLMSHSDNQAEWEDKVKMVLPVEFDWSHPSLNETPINTFGFTRDGLKNNREDRAKIFSLPVAVRPDKSNNRISEQSGLFTLHGGKNNLGKNDEGLIPEPKRLKELNEIGNFLLEFDVPKGKVKESLKNDLLLLQIHTGKMFPELEKQQEFIDLIGLRK